jgi:serine/threonine-protein kinase
MGVVYLARDTQLRRPAALKLLQANLTQDGARVRRFRQEAQRCFGAQSSEHPDHLRSRPSRFAESGTHFIAAEFVDGRTLREQCSAVVCPWARRSIC